MTEGGVVNTNYVFGDKIDMITVDNTNSTIEKLNQIFTSKGFDEEMSQNISGMLLSYGLASENIDSIENGNDRMLFVNMYDNGKYIFKNNLLSELLEQTEPIEKEFNTIDELYNFINNLYSEISNKVPEFKELIDALTANNLEYKYTNEPLNDSNLFLNVVEGPVYKYYLYNGSSFIEIGGSNEGTDAPFITIDSASGATGTLTDEQLATLSADNACVKVIYRLFNPPIIYSLQKTGVIKDTSGAIIAYIFGATAHGFGVAIGAVVVEISTKKYGINMWDSEELDSYIQTLKINDHEYNGSGNSTAIVNLKTINGQDIVGTGDITIPSGEPDVYLKSADYTSNVLTITDNKNTSTKVTIPTVNYPVTDVQVNGTTVLTNKVAKIDLTPYQKTINASNKISADFITTSTTKSFVSDTEKNTWNGKQNAITSSNKLDTALINTSDTAMFVTNAEKSTWNGKQNAITASSKLDPTLINTSATARFVSDTEKTSWNGKQDALVSGTNIKTINGQSLLGAGDIAIKFDGNGYVTTTKFEELVAQTPTDVKFNDDGNMVLMHDTTIITKQTPLSLGEMKGPITVVNITSPAEAVNGTITAAQLATLQKSNMNMIMFNHEVFTLMDKGHTEGFLTYTHVGIENDLIYIKTFTITVSTLAWVLNIRPVPKMEYDESTKTLNIVG